MRRLRFLALLSTAGLWFALSTVSAATESDREGDALPALPMLPPVTVVGAFQNPATGQATMAREIMEQLPAGNGSINDLLGLFPDVQLAEGSRTTSSAGEILPPRFSISGGKTYQNSFLIDGVHNESLLDPAATTSGINDIPGHPQALFLAAGLVEKISVFDSNIPARYGGFTGGVIDVETRDPGADFGGSLFYRTTRADWTRFHLEEGEDTPTDFTKHDAGFDLQVPLSSGSGLLGSYRQLYSQIPLRQLGEPAVQSRRKEDFFLKYVQAFSDADLRLIFAATPYTSENFIANAKNSDFKLEGGGNQAEVEYERSLSFGQWQTQVSYQLSRNSREAPADFFSWANTDRHAWGREANLAYSLEGGFGDLEKEQETVGLRTSLAMEPLAGGLLTHTPEFGLELEAIDGTFERRETTNIYVGPKIEPGIICGADDYACSDGEQYFTSRIVYPQGAVSARMNRGAFFLQDELRLRRFSLRPGVRLSYDDFMENLDIAPRLAASHDLFGNGRTLLIAGFNRYYGQTLLTYKLREAQQPETYEYRSTYQGVLTDWQQQADRGHNVTRYSSLDTPYSDELTAGIDQALLGGRLSLKYVHRDNQDEFARDYGPLQADGLRVFTLTNRGESRHESVRLTWERSLSRHYFSLNGTWQETTASNEDYDDILNTEDLAERVWYEDRIVYKSELPREDFNRSWTANLVYTGKLYYGFSFTNITRYRSGYPSIVDTGATRQVPGGEGRRDPLTGEDIPETLPVWEEKELADGIVFDWVLEWRSPGKRNLLLRLEVDNVFDAKLETGARDEYEVGRQFWAGAELAF